MGGHFFNKKLFIEIYLIYKPYSLFLIFLNLFALNLKTIALEYCVGFCHTSTWVSHRYMYVPSILNLPPTPTDASILLQSTGYELPESYSKFPLAI